jgi:flagellar motility protein MotE (MotC chaperone)
MIARLYSALAVFCVATFLAVSGFVGFLLGSGRLDRQKIELIAAVLRGEPITAPPQSTSQPTAEGQLQTGHTVPAGRQREDLRYHLICRAQEDLKAQKRLLDQAMQHLLSEQDQFARQKEQWQQQQQRLTSQVKEAGTEREVEVVAGLAPKLAKEHIIRLWNRNKADAVALVMQLDVNKTRRILAQMKTPEEQKIMSELLEQLRLAQLEGEARESGTTGGDTAP